MKQALLASLWLLATASIVHAERAVLLPCAGDANDVARKDAEKSLTSALAAQGYEMVERAPAAQPADASQPPCTTADCAEELLAKLQADVAIATAIWNRARSEHGGAMVSVVIIDRKGARYPAEAIDADGKPGAASVTALRAALSLRLLGPGPWVSISTDPEHAKLRIDGKDVGSAPHRRAIDVGTHELEARLDGYRVFKKTFDIPLKAERVFELDATLVEEGEGDAVDATLDVRPQSAIGVDAAPEEPREKDALPSYLAGGALIVAGAALAITPLRTLVKDGDCDGKVDPQGRCAARIEFGAASGVLLGAAAVSILTGTALMIWTPWTIEVGPDRAQATLRFRM